ncbi:sterile alpha motif domain-containing protein 10a isoform X2 [Takifugu rubripes]|uniref:sterile alpha motif domain-containing protein 10a isoform X2 n=1 Tax=Takifugu rubripes TaxID=31033 RepID=UPI001145BF2B|nr:uncharacterized protein LOC101079201 isoform X2 [Takifugu rubripes]
MARISLPSNPREPKLQLKARRKSSGRSKMSSFFEAQLCSSGGSTQDFPSMASHTRSCPSPGVRRPAHRASTWPRHAGGATLTPETRLRRNFSTQGRTRRGGSGTGSVRRRWKTLSRSATEQKRHGRGRFFWKYLIAGFWNKFVAVEYLELFCSVDIGSFFFPYLHQTSDFDPR